MSGRLKQITGPVQEPVTVDDLRLYGRISSDVTDAALASLLASARQQAENYQNRAFITQTWELVFDSFPDYPVQIPLPPLVFLVSVTITDITGTVTPMTLTDFITDTSGGKGTISLKYNKYWPSVIPERAGVVIRFICGYGADGSDVSERVKLAIYLGALWYYDHPGEPMTPAFFAELDPDAIRVV